MFSEDDAAARAIAADVPADQVTDILHTWYGFVGVGLDEPRPTLVGESLRPQGEFS